MFNLLGIHDVVLNSYTNNVVNIGSPNVYFKDLSQYVYPCSCMW